MSRKYKFKDNQQLYFITYAVVDWIDFLALAVCCHQQGLSRSRDKFHSPSLRSSKAMSGSADSAANERVLAVLSLGTGSPCTKPSPHSCARFPNVEAYILAPLGGSTLKNLLPLLVCQRKNHAALACVITSKGKEKGGGDRSKKQIDEDYD